MIPAMPVFAASGFIHYPPIGYRSPYVLGGARNQADTSNNTMRKSRSSQVPGQATTTPFNGVTGLDMPGDPGWTALQSSATSGLGKSFPWPGSENNLPVAVRQALLDAAIAESDRSA
jgi:hypothetical protein